MHLKLMFPVRCRLLLFVLLSRFSVRFFLFSIFLCSLRIFNGNTVRSYRIMHHNTCIRLSPHPVLRSLDRQTSLNFVSHHFIRQSEHRTFFQYMLRPASFDVFEILTSIFKFCAICLPLIWAKRSCICFYMTSPVPNRCIVI